MNNNKENYKKAINEIHASEELKRKTFEKVKNVPNRNFKTLKYIVTLVASILIVLGIPLLNKEKLINSDDVEKNQTFASAENNLPKLKNIEELKNILKNNYNNMSNSRTLLDSAFNVETQSISKSAAKEQDSTNYSKTNVQVENVDEADIVKTDGKNIYYIAKNNLYIINSESLDIISKIEYESDDKSAFYPTEIYIKDNYLVVIGSYREYETQNIQNNDEMGKVSVDYISTSSKHMVKTIVYDISNIQNPNISREVLLDGYYINSRMIDNNIYFISSKQIYYYPEIKDDEILPKIKDSSNIAGYTPIDCSDIIYFKDSEEPDYMLVCGFNITNNDEAKVETFLGASSEIYASENNLYITQYNYTSSLTTIYKFNFKDSDITLQCKTEIEGILNNQFSMDEYDGNLRVAITYEQLNDDETENTKVNRLYVLDENLEKIGEINDFAEGEQIYSVRFIGKIGYVVTFEEIDPLFVIDLSDPTNPQIKGELKIPGYSSYLHPYDENHIIGIGYNTKDNGHGGIATDTIKMSMFDVSDLENPKEIFSTNIGDDNTYSEIMYNHKILFYNNEKNLIGFPILTGGKTGFVIYKINLENNFENVAEVLYSNEKYNRMIQRIIYIDNNLYVLSNTDIVKYDLNTIEMKKENALE